MLPPPLVEWAVWAHLDDHKEPDLILLKGHLLVEACLDERIRTITASAKESVTDLSFFRKLSILEKAIDASDPIQATAVQLAKELNSLRNRLAHEVLFKDGDTSLGEWSRRALQSLPFTKVQRYTPRTRMTQAIAALAKVLYAGSGDA